MAAARSTGATASANGVPESAREHLDDAQGNLRLLGEDVLEVLSSELEQMGVLMGGNRRGPGSRIQQRHLTETLPRPQLSQRPFRPVHSYAAVQNEVKRVPGLAFGEDLVAGLPCLFRGDQRELGQVLARYLR